MKYNEVFKIYNKKDIRRNRLPIFFIALSLFLAMLVSLLIPQIQMGKQQYVENSNKNLSKADLMVDVNFPSMKFEQKIDEYKKDGLKTERISITPIYFINNKNKITVYLLSGYNNLKDDDVIISKNFAKANDVKVDDKIQIAGLNKKVTVTGIEQLPTDVTVDAEVAGYIKMKSSKVSSTENNHLLFIFGEKGSLLKKKLNSIENGYKYYTYQERQDKAYEMIDKEIGALSLISTVGFILSIAVLVSGIVLLIVKSKKDLANLMLISIRKKDIIKAMKIEVNIIIFIPLACAIASCLPVSLLVMKVQNITVDLSINYFIHLLKFIIFDILLFLFYSNLALHYINKLDFVLIEKDENGLEKLRLSEMICCIIPLPITMIIYSTLLQSDMSVVTNIYLAIVIFIVFIILWIIVNLISFLPIWKCWNCTLYTFNNIRSNIIIFVIGTLNLTMLVFFILIGFSLGITLKQSMEKNLITNIPYDYAIRSADKKSVESILDASNDVKGYMKMDYLITKVENEEINNKNILLLNEKASKNNINFHVIKGQKLLKNNTSHVLISEKYAKAYKLTLGSVLRILENNKIHKYTVKGIYDSGGINVNWIIKKADSTYDNTIYLTRYKIGKRPSELKNCYISNMAMVGDYALSQVNDFLKSFKLLSFLFILSAILFNINMIYMNQQLLKKDLAIMEVLGNKRYIVQKQRWINNTLMIVLSLLVSVLLYRGIANVIVKSIAKGNANLDFRVFLFASFVAVITVILGNIISKKMTGDHLLVIGE